MNFFAESVETSIRDDGEKNTTGLFMGWYIIGLTTLYDKLHNSYPSDWWFGTCFLFFYILGISSSQMTFIFFRGVGQPPTSHCIPWSSTDAPSFARIMARSPAQPSLSAFQALK